MTERGRYKTKHHESVREVLLNNPSRCYTVDSICELLNEEGHHIGRTTVYRQLEKMAADGEALKYLGEGGVGLLPPLRRKLPSPPASEMSRMRQADPP